MRLITAAEVPPSLARVHEPTAPPVRVGLVQHAWDADREETETGEKRLNEGDAENAPGDAPHCRLPELGVVCAPFAGEPRGDSARCLTGALSVRQKNTGDDDRYHELQDAEAELGEDPLRHRVDGLPVRDIDFDGEGATACRDDPRRHPVELLPRPASDHDGGAGRGQCRTDPRPEPTATARDDGDPPI